MLGPHHPGAAWMLLFPPPLGDAHPSLSAQLKRSPRSVLEAALATPPVR